MCVCVCVCLLFFSSIGNPAGFSCISTDAFSLVSDASGRMTRLRLDMFIQELLILPAAVFESPSFEYSDGIARNLFDQVRCRCSLFHIPHRGAEYCDEHFCLCVCLQSCLWYYTSSLHQTFLYTHTRLTALCPGLPG